MLKNIRNLDYVVLLCEEILPMKTFYHEILGFQIHRNDEGWVEMKVGGTLLTLRKHGRPYDSAKLPNTAVFNSPSAWRPAKLQIAIKSYSQKMFRFLIHHAIWSMVIAPYFSRTRREIFWKFMPIFDTSEPGECSG